MEPMKPSANRIEVKAMRLSHGMGLPLPQYQTEEAAGLDLLAAVPLTSPLRLLPGMRQLVPTGLTVEIPPGFEGQVRPRSGLALNHGVTVLNSPGTVDSDYRGEIKVLLVNLGRETFVITRGQRIAQLIINSVARAELIDVRAVAASRRGEAGFGSTGLMGSVEADRPVPPAPRAAPVPKIILPPAAPVLAARPIVAARKAMPAPAPAKPAVTAKPVNATKAPPVTANAKAKTAAPPAAKKPAPKAAPIKATPAKVPAGKAPPSKGSANRAPAGKVAAGKRPIAKASAKAQPAKRPVAAPSRAKVPARA
jgi:dUTP pyrophosphatase